MANNLAPLTKRRSFGFQGAEGEMFDLNNQLPGNALVPLITNESIGQNPTPQNYIQRTGGPMINLDYLIKQTEPGATQQPASGPYNNADDLYKQAILASRTPQQAAMAAQQFLQDNPQFAAQPGFSVEELTAQMSDNSMSEMLKQKAKSAAEYEKRMTTQDLSPADRLAREKFEWEKKSHIGGADSVIRKPMTADQEAKYRQKFGEAYGTTINALQSAKNVTQLATELSGHAGIGGITGFTGYMPDMPGSDAAGARQKFETLQGKITKMAKDAAASSGSIGPMAVQEWKILRDQISAIDPTKLDEKQMKSVLDDLVIQAQNASRITEESYMSTFSPDFKMYPQFASPRSGLPQGEYQDVKPMANMPNPKSATGRTVRETSTGIRYKSDGSRWARVE